MRNLVLLLLVSVSLVACSSRNKAPTRLCPQVASVHELDQMADHGRDAMTPDTLVAVATMKRIEGKCKYTDEGVDVSFDLHMQAEQGPRLGGNQVNFPYFVSVISPDGEVLSKEIMTQNFVFEEDVKVTEKVEPLRVFIPLENDEYVGDEEADEDESTKSDASMYRVLLGFQLTPEQLEQVRKDRK